MFCRQIDDAATDVELSQTWRDLCRALVSPRYRAAVEALTGVDLARRRIEITLWVYDDSCWLAPHCDKRGKVVSHVIYFSPVWDRRWGGHLRILRSCEITDCAEEVLPVCGASVVLVRSDSSWHAVEPVSGAPSIPRRSLQVSFWTSDDDD